MRSSRLSPSRECDISPEVYCSSHSMVCWASSSLTRYQVPVQSHLSQKRAADPLSTSKFAVALSISRPITERNQETRKPTAGSEGNLEHFSFANKLSSGITAFKMDAPHLFVQSLSSSCTVDTPVSELFYRMLCTTNVCTQKVTLHRLGCFESSSCIADSMLTILKGRKSS